MPRIVIGSLTGFLLGELSNAYIMERMKVWSRDKYKVGVDGMFVLKNIVKSSK